MKERLLFLHIPKAAGTTVQRHLEREYPEGSVFAVDGGKVRESLAALRTLPEERREGMQVVMGRMPYGVHECLPGRSVYVTLLRDPVERVISNYYFVRNAPAHRLHEKVVSGGIDLESYVLSGLTTQLDNGQTRLLAGDGYEGPETPVGELDERMLERALAHLEAHFVEAGVTEKFGESMERLGKRFGWKEIPSGRENPTINRPPSNEIPVRIRALILQRNQLDAELYRQVLERTPGP